MFEFIKEIRIIDKNIKNGYQNVEHEKPYISMTVIPGVQSIANFGGRECDLRAIFDSYSLNYMEAYNKLAEFKEKLLSTEWESLKAKGYEVDKLKVEPIKDLTFTQNLEKTFRYQWTVRVTYRSVI